MSGLTKEIESQNKKMWLKPPADIQGLRQRLGARDKNFPVVIYAMGDMSSTAYLLFNLYTSALHESGDLKTLVKVASDWLVFIAGRCKRYYSMPDTEFVTTKVVTALQNIKSYNEYYQLVQALQRYYGKMSYWIDLEIPWKELSDTFEKESGAIR